MSTDREGLPERIGEDDAHRLLVRAAEIDATRGKTLTVDQLRDAARESGIASDAFDAALAERRPNAVETPTPRNGHRSVDPSRDVRAWWRREFVPSVTRNGIVIVTGWALLTASHAVIRTVSSSWLAEKAADPLALLLTAAAAASLGARRLAVLAGGFAISQGAEFLLDAAKGAPAVHGRNPHLALMALGLVVAWLVDRRLRRPPTQTPESSASAVTHVETSSRLARLREALQTWWSHAPTLQRAATGDVGIHAL